MSYPGGTKFDQPLVVCKYKVFYAKYFTGAQPAARVLPLTLNVDTT